MANNNKKFLDADGLGIVWKKIVNTFVKKGELDRVTFKTDSLRKYFPKSYTNKQMEDKIIQLLEQWQKKREKSMER